MEEDIELKLLEKKKMNELLKRIRQASEKKKDEDRELVESMLYDRGSEVLERAYQEYPEQTKEVVKEIARLIRNGSLKEKISGGELYSLFRQLGLRFSLETSIKIQERGKLIDISEKFRSREE